MNFVLLAMKTQSTIVSHAPTNELSMELIVCVILVPIPTASVSTPATTPTA